MTVSNTSPLVENKTGNGVWTTIAVTPGQILQNSDGTHAIKVIKTTIADGTAVTLAETTDYTVALDGTSPSTGTITIVAGAPSSSYRYTVLSNLTPKQEVNLQNGTIVDMEDIESALDRLTLYAHKQDEKLERAIVLSEDTLVRELTLDSLDSQAEKVLRVNADEDGFDYVSIAEGISMAAFDINSLSEISLTDAEEDKLPIYDVSAGLTKYVNPNDLGLGDTSILNGNIQQIQYATKTNAEQVTAAAAGDFVDIPGLSVTITPSSITSKLLVGGFVNLSGATLGNPMGVRIVAGNSPIDPLPNIDGVATIGHSVQDSVGTGVIATIPFLFYIPVDTITATTFKVQCSTAGATVTNVNRSDLDTNTVGFNRAVSQLYVMEVLQNPLGATSAVISYNTSVDNPVISTVFTAAAYTAFHKPCFRLSLPSLSTSSYSLLAAFSPCHIDLPYSISLYKNNSTLYNATSPSNRLSCIGGSNLNGYCVPVQMVSTESISSLSTSLYDIRFSEAGSAIGTGNIVALNGDLATSTSTAAFKGVSTFLGINFVTGTTSTWKQLQSTTLSTTYTSSAIGGGTYVDPSLSVSITPNASTNILFGILNITCGADDSATNSMAVVKLQRDGVDILTADTAGNRIPSTSAISLNGDTVIGNLAITFILPATSASATTIKAVVGNNDTSTSVVYVNRSHTDTDSTTFKRGVSQISIIEIDPIA